MLLTGYKSLKQLIQYFDTEEKARVYLEAQRWNGCPECPHCNSNKWYRISDKRYKCGDCKKKYSVTVGTVMENSNIPLSTWFMAIYVLAGHKAGINSIQLGKDIGVTQKSAWFLGHRIRKMFEEEHPLFTGMVEVDEVYHGGQDRHKKDDDKLKKGRGAVNKTPVIGLLQRGGSVKYQVVENTEADTLKPLIREQVDTTAVINTDGHKSYIGLNKEFAGHEVVKHSEGEYVRGIFHTNGIEGAFSQLRRGMYGIYIRMSVKHLQRYCHEFRYRYNTRKKKDYERFEILLGSLKGRLRYKDLIGKK